MESYKEKIAENNATWNWQTSLCFDRSVCMLKFTQYLRMADNDNDGYLSCGDLFDLVQDHY